jgi:RNA polymerase sigma-70 factor (ECF subfamily)
MPEEIQSLIELARHGEEAATGRLLAAYGEYLKLLARVQIGRRLQGKLDASDLVQETFMDAHRQMPNFKGSSEGELLAWLRRILAGHVAMTVRRYFGAKGRDINLERGIAAQIDQSSQAMDGGLIGSNTTPSQHVARREQSVLLADALAKLSEDHREAIVLRHLEGLSLVETAARMGRSEDSVQKLYVRGLMNLRRLMGSVP